MHFFSSSLYRISQPNLQCISPCCTQACACDPENPLSVLVSEAEGTTSSAAVCKDQPCPYLWIRNPAPQHAVRLTTASLGSLLPSRLDRTSGEERALEADFSPASLAEGGSAHSLSLPAGRRAEPSQPAPRLRHGFVSAGPVPALHTCPTAASGTQHTHYHGACPTTKPPPCQTLHAAAGEEETEAMDLRAPHSRVLLTSKSHTDAPLEGKCFINTTASMGSS